MSPWDRREQGKGFEGSQGRKDRLFIVPETFVVLPARHWSTLVSTGQYVNRDLPVERQAALTLISVPFRRKFTGTQWQPPVNVQESVHDN